MRTTLRASRLGAALLASAVLTTFALSGCAALGTGSGGAGNGATTPAATSGSTAPASTGPAVATHKATATPAPAKTRPVVTTPAGGPVPSGFAATSVTFVSTQEAFVLGTAPCSHAPCTSIVRTLDRGASWRGLPAPVVPLGQSEGTAGSAVWGIRFANPEHGFVFGTGLWETTDGGEHWAAVTGPGASIVSLEVIDHQLLALTVVCQPQNGCAQEGVLMRRQLAGGSWYEVAQVANAHTIATQAGVAAVLDGANVLVTADGGLTSTTHATPCTTQGVSYASSVAVTGTSGLALLCSGGAAAGSVEKTVYVSGDLGAHWTKAGLPARGGDPFGIAAGTPSQLVVAAASGASWLYYSGDSAAKWGTAYVSGDGGLGFNDLGFTSATDGVVVHGPALNDNNQDGRPGQLLLTSDGGASWHRVQF